MMENVAALVSQKFIGTFNQWQLELERYGYTNFAQVLNAKDYGVPQNRERIFMISILDCEESYYFPKKMKLTIRLKDVLEKEVEERYYLHDSKDKRLAQIVTEQGNKILHETSATILCGIDSRRHHFVAEEPIVLGWVRDEKGNVVKRPPVEVANCVTSGKRDNTQNYVVEPKKSIIEDYIPTENGAIYKGKEIAEGDGLYLSTTQDFFRGGLPGVSRALESECCDAGVCQNYRIRKLTERECFRLMGVRDEDSDKIRAMVSKSQCYKLAGNSIVVDVMVRIFDQLLFGNKNKNQQLEIF